MLLPIRTRLKIDAKGGIVLIKFFEGTWHCVGYKLPTSRHLSKKLARDHVLFTWKNFTLKSIDHNGVLEVEDFIEVEKPINKAIRHIKEAWSPPPLPLEIPEPSTPAWLPHGKIAK